MSGVTISAACTGCGMCLVTCPERALRRAPRRPVLVADRCTLCLACIEICPVDAIADPGCGVSPQSPGCGVSPQSPGSGVSPQTPIGPPPQETAA